MAIHKNRETSDSRIASLKLQDKEYNEMYRKWRIEHKNDYGFYFFDNSDELTYRDGEGFITEYPEAAERAAAVSIHSVIANAMTIYMAINLLVTFVSSFMPLLFGVNFSYNLSGFFMGDEPTAITLSYIVNIFSRLIPFVYLLEKTKIPSKIFFTTRVSNKPLFKMSLPISMFVFAICTLLSGFLFTEIGFIGIDTANKIWQPQSVPCKVLSALLFVVIIPVISEIIHRGIIMQALRQFGDGYALAITSIISGVITGDIRNIFFTFVTSFIIGYFVMRTGTITTAVIMRLVISASSYFLTVLKNTIEIETIYLTISIGILLVYFVVGAVSLISFMKNHSNKINLPLYGMYLSQKERLLCCMSNPAVIIWCTLTFLNMIIFTNGVFL